MTTGPFPRVEAVHLGRGHDFSKAGADVVRLLAGIGVEGDAHAGETVKHRSRVALDPTQPNLRQVHLIHAELFDELAARGFDIRPGDLGENVTTRGIDLLPSTHVHALLQKLLGYAAPQYAHHPLLTDASGRRFAKRDRDLTIRALRERGRTPAEVFEMIDGWSCATPVKG